MREILFRGKRVNDGEWVFGYYMNAKHHWNKLGVHEDWILCNACQNGGWFTLLNKYAVDPSTVGQYTGLIDKNGVKIFEGDIVTFEDAVADYEGYHDDVFLNRGEVTYTERGMCLYFTNRQVVVMDDLFYKGTADCEVVGNIYDNPALAGKEGTE